MGKYYIKKVIYEDGRILFTVKEGCYNDGLEEDYMLDINGEGEPYIAKKIRNKK